METTTTTVWALCALCAQVVEMNAKEWAFFEWLRSHRPMLLICRSCADHED